MAKTKETKASEAYGADSIQTLEGLASIRKRPGMYIADIDEAGLHQLLAEVVDNGIDEYLGGHNKIVRVTINTKDGSCEVEDEGRGVPTGINKKSGLSAMIMALGIKDTGGKFEKGAYKTSAGLHGVGVKATNALSKRFEATSHHGGTYTAAWEKGILKEDLKCVSKKPTGKGTRIKFWPDPTVFSTVQWNVQRICELLEEASFTCPGLKLEFKVIDAKHPQEFSYQTSKGLVERLRKMMLADGVESRHKPLVISAENADIVIAWTTGVMDAQIVSYVNTKFMPEGGAHETGLKRAITTVVNREKAAEGLESGDFRNGMYAVVHYKCGEPIFKGQSKTALLNKEADGEISRVVVPEVEQLFEDDPGLLNSILKRAEFLKKSRKQMKDLAKVISKIDEQSRGRMILPDKLASCPNCPAHKRELYLVEGESAGGTAKLIRDKGYQEVLSLKGKPINAIQATAAAALNNEEIRTIVASIGCGVDQVTEGDGCNPDKARVGNVYLLMDADPDGRHITCLVLAFMLTYMKPFVKAGRVHIIVSPLFIGRKGNKRAFTHTLKAAQDQLGPGAHILRLKGHGEAQAPELREYAFNPDKRVVIDVQCDGVGEAVRLMDKDVEPRKQLLGLVPPRHKLRTTGQWIMLDNPEFVAMLDNLRTARSSK